MSLTNQTSPFIGQRSMIAERQDYENFTPIELAGSIHIRELKQGKKFYHHCMDLGIICTELFPLH